MPHTISRYGWVKDALDPRDFMYAAPPSLAMKALPPKADLRKGCPPVYDQGQIGSCTANAISGAFEFAQKKQGLTDFMPARLFVYYNERDMEHTVKEDSGAQIRDGIKSVATLGVCPETEWPYSDTLQALTKKPTASCYSDAKHHTVVEYHRISNTQADQFLKLLKNCLSGGYPFVFGFVVYESFESATVAKTGVMPMPDITKEKQIGGHAVMAAGYDDTKKAVLVRNSWGPKWGVGGYFWMPYQYITNSQMASDFWTISGVTDTSAKSKAKAKAAGA